MLGTATSLQCPVHRIPSPTRDTKKKAEREGNLEAPTRHPIDWKNPDYYDEARTLHEMERIFDICHGCRRCVSLCGSFPTLFDLVDESKTGEVDGVDKQDYWKVVDQCYVISSDCPLGGHHIAQGFEVNQLGVPPQKHPLTLVREAYGIK